LKIESLGLLGFCKATKIDIKVKMDFRGEIKVVISDNGIGMDKNGLLNAMTYGSRSRENAASLGKFGLGLKTASTAFCRKLSVISRASGSAAALKATWDLDHVAKVKKWNLMLPDPAKDELEHLEKVAKGTSGTVVVWDEVDRLIRDYETPGGPPANKALNKKIEELSDHISMVHQRFIDPLDKRCPNVDIFLNDKKLVSWDPFCTGESELVATQTPPVETPSGTEATFTVNAYILPRREEFSTPEAAKVAKLNNDMQGIYVYRENRLIHGASWLNMFTKEPHGTLLRVEFSFDHKLDDAFHIDIKKSQIRLDQDLWGWLKEQFLTAPRREANNRYRQGQQKKATEKAQGSHETSNRNIASKEKDVDSTTINPVSDGSGDCLIENKNGKFRFKFPVVQSERPGEFFIQPVPSLNDNALFEPALIESHKAVRINTSHPYYHKVYVPNLTKGVTIQGMDSLFWALSIAELNCSNPNTMKHFDEVRFEISRVLRKLVEDLPEPDLESDETQ
jgi:hypothetical protein